MEEEHESFQKLSKGSNEELQSHELSQSAHLLAPLNHTSTRQHNEIVTDPAFRTSFPLRERISTWCWSCFRCNPTDSSFVNNLTEMQRKNTANISDEQRKLMQDKIVKLKILQTSRLELDPNVMHPFVKVHIVNKNTGCYIQNLQKTQDPAIFHTEHLTSYDKVEKRFVSHQNDILLPFSTKMCDFRTLGNSKGIWNQKFFINYPARLLFHPDTLFLFEILDFNHSALTNRTQEDIYDRNNMYRVAWAYLRPAGISSKLHIGQFHLELYRYKYYPSPEMVHRSFIPDVFYDFLWPSHQKYEGFLEVKLNYCKMPRTIHVQQGKQPQSLFDEEPQDPHFLDRYANEEYMKEEDEKPKISNELLKFLRNKEICEIPKQLIYKLESDQKGCFRVKFLGNYLFAAVSNRKYTTIKGFNLENGEEVMALKGHRGVIYDMQTIPNQKILVTVGSDHIARIWNIPEETGEYIDEEESEIYIKGECIHTAAVYSAALIFQKLQEIIYMVTCCYDGYLRLWECNLAEQQCLISKEILINDYSKKTTRVFPTCCTVFENSFFVVGDSIGDIRIFDYSKDKFTLRCHIAPEELKDDRLLSVRILKKSHLIIQASDNLIRHYELIGNRLRLHQTYTGGQFERQLAGCVVSPDYKYLLSPSQSGQPMLWDVFTGGQVSLSHLNINLRGKLTTCDWHPKYNLVALSGFIDYCPVFVLGNVLSESQIKLVSAQQ